MGVDNSSRTHDWGDMQSTVRSVRLLTFRDLVKPTPKRRTAKRKPVKKAKRRGR